MARIRHIARARQRYVMVPELDDEGKPKRVPVNRTARGGKQVTRPVTHADHDQPLPPRTCDYLACDKPDKIIAIGTPMKILTVKQQFGAMHRFRHESCPDWNPTEYTSALWARVAEIQGDGVDVGHVASEEDAQSVVDELAQKVRDLADEKQESLDNMPDGLRDASELSQQVDDLNSWADEFDNITIPDLPDGECQECEGTGEIGEGDDAKSCEQCGGDGTVEPDDEAMDAWRDELEQELQAALDNSPF